MLLRSGRATSLLGPRRRSAGSTLSRGFDEAAGRVRGLKRKPAVEVEASLRRQFRSNSPPASPCEQAQTPPGLHPPEVGAEAPLSPPEVAVSTAQGTTDGDDSSEASEEASVAELGVKLFPSISPVTAAAVWVDFVNNAKTCIKHYNKKHEANFVYKHAACNGSIYIEEQDGGMYFHINFMAQDKKGHSQLFFGEIKMRDMPKEEDVTCCCPVSPSDAGGKNNIEEAGKRVFPMWGTAGVDQEHCYACLPRMKHPEGTHYVAGHYADTRQYDGL